ncbi:SCP2 sterol-binding domain-containing protein [Halomarina rubra]|uniref:SCP2 sterol-binding domain-containing protein n=1 Tax=Halomarina rubra TaxID=2071873 RepID=A0ABD6AWB2_9EURY|nr:SCP2 sterol-binding domain-containing protein [Halomarina rubra]
MSNVEYDPDPLLFPSQAWFEAYEEAINDDEAYREASEGWGVDFEGDFLFEMTEMPVEEMDTAAMPEYLREELDEYVTPEEGKGHVGRAYLGLEDGRCTGARLVEPDSVDPGFRLTAPTETWKALLDQEIGIIDGMMSGKFQLDGDMQKVLQYSQAAVRLTDIAGEIDAAFADERYDGG